MCERDVEGFKLSSISFVVMYEFDAEFFEFIGYFSLMDTKGGFEAVDDCLYCGFADEVNVEGVDVV